MAFTWSESLTGIIKFSVLDEIRDNIDWLKNNLACASQNVTVDTVDNSSALSGQDVSVNGNNYSYCSATRDAQFTHKPVSYYNHDITVY